MPARKPKSQPKHRASSKKKIAESVRRWWAERRRLRKLSVDQAVEQVIAGENADGQA
jgi:hypothetical protein